MALTNPKIFGLHVKSSLADVRDKGTALRNLGINPLDLEIIRGSSPNMVREDWVSFSRLKQPLFKILSRYSTESNIFSNILLERAGTDQTLFGNLDINGSISGNAIRYRFLDGDNPAKIADISTSRVSAWSSSDSRATATLPDGSPDLAEQAKAKISYGARVGINTGGKLIFGTPFDDAPRLQTSLVPELREFESEIPTSKIKCNINGNTVYLYAMKGIPLVFKGTFRKFSSTINITPPASAPNLLGNWKIIEVRNPNRSSSYVNRGNTTSSSLSYNSVVTRDRFIQFYYPPDNITGITLTSVALRELPNVKLSICEQLNFSSNELRLFPNFKFIAPNLRTLTISNNLFYLADDEIEQSFVPQVAERIPSTLTTLTMSGSFKGSINRNIIPKFLPNLTNLTFSGGRSPFTLDNRPGGTYVQTGNLIVVTSELHGLSMVPNNNTVNIDFLTSSTNTIPTDETNIQVIVTSENTFQFNTSSSSQDATGTCNITYTNHNNAGNQSFCPDIPETVTSYNISNNDFRSVDRKAVGTSSTVFSNGSYTFKTAPLLTTLSVSGNVSLNDSDSGGDSSLACFNTIKNINYSTTALKIPSNLAGSQSLESYSASNNRAQANQLVDGSGNYAFDGCINLTSLTFEDSNLGLIPFPDFSNPKLISINLVDTSIQGGKFGSGGENFVIHASTFAQCSELETIRIRSNKLLNNVGIDENAFASNPKLKSFTYNSSGRTSGSISQLFKNNDVLQTLIANGNAFSGSIPNFQQNPNIYYVDLSSNNFTGNIPGFTNLSNLRQIRLQNNNCTSMGNPELLTNLHKYTAQNNLLSGSVPDFSTCPQLRSLSLNNNLFTSYTSGSFATLTRINFIDLSNCKLGQAAQNAIIDDLKLSYDNGNRSRLVINLRGNSAPNDPNQLIEPSTDAKKIARDLVRVSNWTIVVNGGLGSDEPEE